MGSKQIMQIVLVLPPDDRAADILLQVLACIPN